MKRTANKRLPSSADASHTLGTPEELRTRLIEVVTPSADRAHEAVRKLIFEVIDFLIDHYKRGGTELL